MRIGFLVSFLLIFHSCLAGAQVIPRGESFTLEGLRIKILRQISEGTYAKVYKAEALIDGIPQTVAVKPFFSSRYSNATLDEIGDNYSKLQQLAKESSEIVPILRVGIGSVTALDDLEFDEKEDNRRKRNNKLNALIIVMEYADRDLNLPDLKAESSPSELVQRLELVSKLILAGESAIGALAKNGTIHGDIKPSNFLLNSKGQILLADFDHMTSVRKNHSEFLQNSAAPIEISRSTGTPGYHPPEFLDGRAYIETSDRYSLAMTTLKLLTGKTLHDFIENSNISKALNETEHSLALKLASEHMAKLKEAANLKKELSQKMDSISQYAIQNLSYNAQIRQSKFKLDLKSKLCSKIF